MGRKGLRIDTGGLGMIRGTCMQMFILKRFLNPFTPISFECEICL